MTDHIILNILCRYSIDLSGILFMNSTKKFLFMKIKPGVVVHYSNPSTQKAEFSFVNIVSARTTKTT